MKTDQLVAELTALDDVSVRSVVLYGSAAAGDHTGKGSDLNILVVTGDLGIKELHALSPVARRWARAGNRPPLLFTEEQLRRSADVFPIELLDMKDSRRVLYGEDLLESLQIDPRNLRLQLEHELKGKLIYVREQYLLCAGRPRAVRNLMLASLSTFLVLLRAALRLFSPNVPARKIDALRELNKHIPCAPDVFEEVLAIKEGRSRTGRSEIAALFARYLRAVEAVTDSVDAYLHEKRA